MAIPLLPKVKEELQRMQDAGVISKVEQPTQWCAGMVVVPKADGRVRICVDLTKLNECIYRERHIMPSVEQTLAQIGGATVFSKLDANSGFWQVELAPESSLLTTFITPLGRFCFNRMPFGITSAPEYFQRRMSKIVEGLEGVVCMVDDILVFAKTQEEHDRCLRAVLDRIKEAGLTLNKDKCVFNQRSVKFLGQVIDKRGIRPDPDKVSAVLKMKPPSTTTEVRRFLGMANQLTKFSPHLADKMKPLNDLLSTRNAFVWGPDQDKAFQEIKQSLSSGEVLARYDTNLETSLSADASSYGLGAVLRQKQPGGEWRPTAYISRAMSKVEERYAQIEKEALASTWACERLQDYLLGKRFHIETDHKPLVPLMSSKSLDELPLRVQRFPLRLMRFDFSICHVPGKDLCTADTLSRSPGAGPDTSDQTFQQEVQAFLDIVTGNLPATDNRIDEIRSLQEQDAICQQLSMLQTSKSERGTAITYSISRTSLEVRRFRSIRMEIHIIPSCCNGEAERAVQTIKNLLTKNDDPYLALLSYRSTPLENGYSPAELLMGRKLRTVVPMAPSQLIPSLPKTPQLRERERKIRERRKRNFDSNHGARKLEPLDEGDEVWITDMKTVGRVVKKVATRSYLVNTSKGTYRRNRCHLIRCPAKRKPNPLRRTLFINHRSYSHRLQLHHYLKDTMSLGVEDCQSHL